MLNQKTGSYHLILPLVIGMVLNISEAAASCASSGFASVSRSEARARQVVSLLNTFDYSREFTREEATRYIDERLPEFTIDRETSWVSRLLTEQSLEIMRRKAFELSFGLTVLDSKKASAAQRLVEIEQQAQIMVSNPKLRTFDELTKVRDLKQRDLALWVIGKIDQARKTHKRSPNRLHESIFDAVDGFAKLIHHSARHDPRVPASPLRAGIFDHDPRESASVIERIKQLRENRQIHIRFPITAQELDHFDELLLWSNLELNIGLLLKAVGIWDMPQARYSVAFPGHDLGHSLNFLYLIHSVYQESKSKEALIRQLKYEYVLLRALLIESLTLPKTQRISAILFLFQAKHEEVLFLSSVLKKTKNGELNFGRFTLVDTLKVMSESKLKGISEAEHNSIRDEMSIDSLKTVAQILFRVRERTTRATVDEYFSTRGQRRRIQNL